LIKTRFFENLTLQNEVKIMPDNKNNKRQSFAPGALTAPLPPVLVTVGDMTDANIITIAWTGILATIPPKTYISVRPSRHSYGILKERGEFVINLPSASLVREVDYAGIYTGAKVDKFEKCGFSKVESKEVSAPTIGECPIALECKITEILPMGSHDVFMADIVSVSCREDVLENGRICYDNADLLAYAHGEYFALGEKLGKFGFSTDKENKAAIRSRGEKDGARTASPKEKLKEENKKASPRNGKGDAIEATAPKKKAHRGQANPPEPKGKKRGKRPFDKPKKSSIKRK
jgi:flavin reductase (DIM6/NTAB) family NADH-FMN oxidoreductase RutF